MIRRLRALVTLAADVFSLALGVGGTFSHRMRAWDDRFDEWRSVRALRRARRAAGLPETYPWERR